MTMCKKVVVNGIKKFRNMVSPRSHKPANRGAVHISSPNEERFSRNNDENRTNPMVFKPSSNGFDLSRLNPLFDAYSIDICAYDALYHLLNAIEKASYINTLKTISEKIKSPDELIAFSEALTCDNPLSDVSFVQGGNGPWVTREYVQNLCRDKGTPFIDSMDETIRNLIVENVKSGESQFNVFFGHRIQSLKENILRGEDVSSQFSEIMKRIKVKISTCTEASGRGHIDMI